MTHTLQRLTEIERLLGEVEDAAVHCRTPKGYMATAEERQLDVNRLSDARAALRATLREALRDGERLDWLASHDDVRIDGRYGLLSDDPFHVVQVQGADGRWGVGIRAAIDAAMSPPSTEPGT